MSESVDPVDEQAHDNPIHSIPEESILENADGEEYDHSQNSTDDSDNSYYHDEDEDSDNDDIIHIDEMRHLYEFEKRSKCILKLIVLLWKKKLIRENTCMPA